MKYPKVQHSHIVPRAYLRCFAVNGLLDMRLTGAEDVKRVSVRDAAVRRDAYKRTRPTGEVIYDVEWSIGQAENKALPLVRDLAARWPLDVGDKSAVGTIFALQLLRGPRWMNWYAEKIANTHEALQGKDISSPGGVVLPPALVEVAGHQVREQLQRLVRVELLATVVAVASRDPTTFRSFGQRWTMMRRDPDKKAVDMQGIAEARDERQQMLYRLFCVIDSNGAEHGLSGPSIVLLDGRSKPSRTAMPQRDYKQIDALREEYWKTHRVASPKESPSWWPNSGETSP